jgi:hypothetical protein
MVTDCPAVLLWRHAHNQITELANSTSALQQDKEALQDALDTTRADLALARDQLAATTTSSSGLASELAQLKGELREAGQKLAEAGEAHAAALGVVMARDKEVAELKRQLATAEEAVAAATDEAAMQVSWGGGEGWRGLRKRSGCADMLLARMVVVQWLCVCQCSMGDNHGCLWPPSPPCLTPCTRCCCLPLLIGA